MENLERIIEETKEPVTKSFLIKKFNEIGLKKGDKILVHSKLSSLGWVAGGARTVVDSLMEVIGEEGTIAMPTHSGDLVDPVFWGNPPVPNEWFETIRDEMPAFDREKTETYGMGKIVENFRCRGDVLRSYHPTVSFSAWGREAEEVTKEHTLEYSLGEGSPLKKMYELNFKVLFIGVEYDVNTAFHLSEYRAGNGEKITQISPIIENGERKFKKYEDIEFKTELFMFVGEGFEEKGNVIKNQIGNAKVKIFSMKEAVDFGVEYFKNVSIY
ncbi:AAC(3) family N-acetyltransferase [uncultured Clostridium sp.]|uniref:aminoglycoside N(3)-acetyltransferase n=1 Tax=uncultured Clostridium sp. TaxID=59620 RepID=UPI0026040080|nr:AAC(3) family N-acetyltransferase [uncultured Clostridium sp.]